MLFLESIEYITLSTERLMNYGNMVAQSGVSSVLAFLVPAFTILTTLVSISVHKISGKPAKFHITVSLCFILSIALGFGMLFNSLNSYIENSKRIRILAEINANNVKSSATLKVGKEYDPYYFIDDMDSFYSQNGLTFGRELADQDWCTLSDNMKRITVIKEVSDVEVPLFFVGGDEYEDVKASVPVRTTK